MIGVSDALDVVLGAIAPLPPEKIPILEASGRILTEDLAAPWDLPPRDNSAMDGFAIRHADVSQGIRRFRFVDAVAAGQCRSRVLRPGEAAKVMTGAPIPQGADAVVPLEDVLTEEAWVEVVKPPSPGAHIRPAGEDVRKGDLVLAQGARIRPPDAAMMAALGRAFVSVRRRPRVAILSTGDEICEVDQVRESQGIVDANSYSLAALVADTGGDPIRLGIAPDHPTALVEMLACADGTDTVLTSGGVSMGDKDYVRPLLEKLGVDIRFAKVAIKPGKPMVFGTKGRVPVFGLPGNPVAAVVGFEVFVRPALRRLQGQQDVFPSTWSALLGEEAGTVRSTEGRMEFLRCRVERRAGEFRVVRVMKPGSGLLSTLVHSNAFLIMDEQATRAEPGTRVPVQIFDGGALLSSCWEI